MLSYVICAVHNLISNDWGCSGNRHDYDELCNSLHLSAPEYDPAATARCSFQSVGEENHQSLKRPLTSFYVWFLCVQSHGHAWKETRKKEKT